ncbi:MAG: hypothetical protein ACOYNY_15465 [Caldilineaceae bacterium]|jgi:hypothetical protein
MIDQPKDSTLIQAIYRHGIFEPLGPVQGLVDEQPVQLRVWFAAFEEVTSPDFVELDFVKTMDEQKVVSDEWETLDYWEQQGRRAPDLSLEEVTAQVEWVQNNWASIPLPSTQALEIATATWLAEENWDL